MDVNELILTILTKLLAIFKKKRMKSSSDKYAYVRLSK